MRPVLAFDSSGPHLAAALLREGGDLLRLEAMERGQAERLMPFLEGLLAGAGLGWRDLAALAVGVGPGNFTGVRIAVSAARGLALGLGVPALGLSGFELMRDPAALDDHPDELVSLPAPRGLAYVQRFGHGRAMGPPQLIDPAQPPAALTAARVRGHRAAELAARLGATASAAGLDDLPGRLAATARWRLAQGAPEGRPAPLYVRPAEAAPPSEAPPALIG